jgi:hypothetical protein
MIRLFALLLVLSAGPPALGQALHLTGTRSGAGLSMAFMSGEESPAFALSAGLAFSAQWEAGVVYGSSVQPWPAYGLGGTIRRKTTTSGLYLGFVPKTTHRNDMRVRIGINGQVAAETEGSRSITLFGLDFAAAKPLGGAAYLLPGIGGGIVFPLSHMQPTTVAAASLGLGLRGADGSVLLEPTVVYVPAGHVLSKGIVVTVAFSLAKPPREADAPTPARTSAR